MKKEIKTAVTQSELAELIEDYLSNLDDKYQNPGLAYEDVAGMLHDDGYEEESEIMEQAAERWHELT